MSVNSTQISIRGRTVTAPSVQIGDKTVIVTGRWIRLASIYKEDSVEGEVVPDPKTFVQHLRAARVSADIFTFAQRIPDINPKHNYHFEWDNVAAIPITTYVEWFGKRAATDVRQNVKKAGKRGVTVRVVPFDNGLVNGIVEIYNESSLRQGKRFWHYGKDFETIKKETAHCLERSEFIGAYVDQELIGFIKLLYTGPIADIVLIVTKQQHFDRRATNALIAKAVEVCEQRGATHLTYAKYSYGKKTHSSLSEFKRRHGFEQIRFPRYYVPLTFKGRIATKLKLYREIKDLLPESVIKALLAMRVKFYEGMRTETGKPNHQVQGSKT
jgi:hypothetical protein